MKRWLTAALFLVASTTGAQTFPHLSVIDVNSLTTVTGSTTLFMSSGTGVDATEANVSQKLLTRAILINLQCQASATVGAQTITLTGMSGTCGSTTAQSFTCALTGTTACGTGTSSLTVNAGECWDLRLTFSGSLGSPVFVVCSLERAL